MLALYGHPFSSYTWKALIPLYANGTDFAFREVGPDHPDHAAFVAAAHPAGKFPVLDDDGTVVIEATAIIEHLALRHPGPAPLIPADPAEAIITRMLDRVFDNYVMANMQRVVNAYIANRDTPDPAEVAAGRNGLLRVYRWLETWLGENALPPHVSLVTCAAAPSLFYADWVERIPGDCPRVAALRAELLVLPPVARCVDDARPYRPWFPPGAPDRDRQGEDTAMADTKELSVTRYIDAPPETVWDVMVNRQEEWWCPKPWRAEFDVNERRPGGRNEVRMHGPEGEVHTHNGMYLAFDDGRRFVSTDAVQGDFEPADPFMIGIWEIEPEGSGTRYTATARHWTDDAKQRHEEMGFAEGWGVCADQLQALSEEAAKGSGS